MRYSFDKYWNDVLAGARIGQKGPANSDLLVELFESLPVPVLPCEESVRAPAMDHSGGGGGTGELRVSGVKAKRSSLRTSVPSRMSSSRRDRTLG